MNIKHVCNDEHVQWKYRHWRNIRLTKHVTVSQRGRRAARCNAASAEGSGQRTVAVLTATVWQCVWTDFYIQQLSATGTATSQFTDSSQVTLCSCIYSIRNTGALWTAKKTRLKDDVTTTGELQLREMSLHAVQGQQSCCVDNPEGRVVGPACDRTKGAMLAVRSGRTLSTVNQSANPTRHISSVSTLLTLTMRCQGDAWKEGEPQPVA